MRFHYILGRCVAAFVLALMWMSAGTLPVWGGCGDCEDCGPRVALKTNLLHDALLVPDLGVEVEMARRYSISLEGVYARWGSGHASECWRVGGGWIELRRWFGKDAARRVLGGHRIGIFGGVHQFDFCLGGHGVQSEVPAFSAGISYGYSFKLRDRLNLDVGIRAGYVESRYKKYRNECGELVARSRGICRYWGITDLGITLVWMPGRGNGNRGVY